MMHVHHQDRQSEQLSACHPERSEGSVVWARDPAWQRRSFAALRMTEDVCPTISSTFIASSNVKPLEQPDAMKRVPTISQNSLQENGLDSLKASMPEFNTHCKK